MPGLNEIVKASISATDTTLSGTLTPEQAHAFVDAVKDNSSFLKKIGIEKMSRLTKELDTWDVAKRVLVRVSSGQKPTEEQRRKLGVIGTKLNASDVQLFARILQDALEENKHNPKFESETFTTFTKAFGNDLTLLGFEGISDTYDNTNFNTLHKGWLQIAKESSDTLKVTYAQNETMSNRLKALVQAIPDDAKADTVILINPSDVDTYNLELSQLNSPAHLIEGGARKILGVPFEIVPQMPKGKYLATPLQNLVFGMVLDIRRNRAYDIEERCLKYVFDVFCDYEIAIKKWVVHMEQTA